MIGTASILKLPPKRLRILLQDILDGLYQVMLGVPNYRVSQRLFQLCEVVDASEELDGKEMAEGVGMISWPKDFLLLSIA